MTSEVLVLGPVAKHRVNTVCTQVHVVGTVGDRGQGGRDMPNVDETEARQLREIHGQR